MDIIQRWNEEKMLVEICYWELSQQQQVIQENLATAIVNDVIWCLVFSVEEELMICDTGLFILILKTD